MPVDELVIRSLREQEQRLRAVVATFARAERRMAQLDGNVGWIGPARDAYGFGVFTLRAELRAAEDHLAAALAGTTNAVSVSASQGSG